MKNISIEDVVKELYNNRIMFIRDKNIELERQYFSKDKLGFLTNGLSFSDNFTHMIKVLKDQDINESKVDNIFLALQEVFLFSKGHDMMFKKKLEADIFVSVPIDELIYPLLVKNVKEKYNDVSIMKENPNYDRNIKDINRLTNIYTDLQSLLYFLYYNDFQFPGNWEELYPDTYNDLIKILNESGMTIGDFLHSLIDFKCNTMINILKEIENRRLQELYLLKVEDLRKEKHNETNTFTHIHLPITYFLDNTFNDFMEDELNRSSITENPESKNVRKIILK